MPDSSTSPQTPDSWNLRRPFSLKMIAILLAVTVCLGISARRTEMDRAVALTVEGLSYFFGLTDDAEIATGWHNFFKAAWPLTLSEKREVNRISDFDRDDLPAFSRLVVEPEREYDLEKGKFVVIGQKEYLVERFGY
ncbi:MAG: hypothetical protein ABGZ35_06785, partial [Planctomycetaceae bacterium]